MLTHPKFLKPLSHLFSRLLVRPHRHMLSPMVTDTRFQASYKGSISAEHGIGLMKAHALPYSKDAISIAWMKKLKELFDPRGIMNPGKVLV